MMTPLDPLGALAHLVLGLLALPLELLATGLNTLLLPLVITVFIDVAGRSYWPAARPFPLTRVYVRLVAGILVALAVLPLALVRRR